MVRFGKWEIYHDKIKAMGFWGHIYVKVLGCVSISAYLFFRDFKRAIKGIQFQKVLDAGCGKGDFTFYLAEKYPDVQISGCDLSEFNIKICQEIQKKVGFKNVHFFKQDLLDVKAKDKYDLIFCIEVLEHIRENKQVLKSFHKALKESGYLYIHMPTQKQKRLFNERYFTYYDKWAEIEHVGQHYTLETLQKDLEDLGFSILRTKETFGLCGRLAWEISEIVVNYKSFFLLAIIFPFLKCLSFIDDLLLNKGGDHFSILAKKS